MQTTSSNRKIFSRALLSGVLSVLFATVIFGGAAAQSQGPQREIFLPAGGKGAIVENLHIFRIAENRQEE